MKVYYNESCSICRAEINLYKKQNIKEIDWVDITNNVAAEDETSKDDKNFVRLRRKKNKIITLMYSVVMIMFICSMSLLSQFLLFFIN